ncbi:hypothetical protein SO694_00147033 [Aureococcus anophagefferens]|uniref:Uncharacterized protein n=1 Tax=Aureococcus anophagefferens TaxID=44056 RepID=A0ABR1FNA7_AURAN
MLGDARDATAGDGAGVNRAALVPFSNVERRVKNVTPDLAVEPADKVRRIFDVKTAPGPPPTRTALHRGVRAERRVARGQAGVLRDNGPIQGARARIDVEINGVSDGPMPAR